MKNMAPEQTHINHGQFSLNPGSSNLTLGSINTALESSNMSQGTDNTELDPSNMPLGPNTLELFASIMSRESKEPLIKVYQTPICGEILHNRFNEGMREEDKVSKQLVLGPAFDEFVDDKESFTKSEVYYSMDEYSTIDTCPDIDTRSVFKKLYDKSIYNYGKLKSKEAVLLQH